MTAIQIVPAKGLSCPECKCTRITENRKYDINEANEMQLSSIECECQDCNFKGPHHGFKTIDLPPERQNVIIPGIGGFDENKPTAPSAAKAENAWVYLFSLFEKEILMNVTDIDPVGHVGIDWESLALGWAIGKGIDIERAWEFTGYATDQMELEAMAAFLS